MTTKQIISIMNLLDSINMKPGYDIQKVVTGTEDNQVLTLVVLRDSVVVGTTNSSAIGFNEQLTSIILTVAAGHLPEPAPEETTYDSLLCAAREELKDAIRELHVTDEDDDDIRDRLTEIVDSNVPFINHKLFEVFANGGISYEMDDEGLIDGVSDVIKIMQTRIYEELSNDLYGELEGLIQEYNDELEDEAGTCGYGDDDE